jgi:hypothetical protein
MGRCGHFHFNQSHASKKALERLVRETKAVTQKRDKRARNKMNQTLLFFLFLKR